MSREIVQRLEKIRNRIYTHKGSLGWAGDLVDFLIYQNCQHEFEERPNPSGGEPRFIEVCKICDLPKWES